MRKKALSTKNSEGLSFAQVSERFKVGKASVIRWSKNINYQTTRNKLATKISMIALRQDVEDYCDAYLHERAQHLGMAYKKTVSKETA